MMSPELPSPELPDNALVAITLMIAESQPKEKNIIAALVVNLIRTYPKTVTPECFCRGSSHNLVWIPDYDQRKSPA